MSALAPVLEGYFSERLAARRVSPRTVETYRDSFCLWLAFAESRTGTPPSRLDLGQLDAELVMAFLDHLETDRGNGVSTRNLRLAALHGLYGYAALRCPEHAALIQRVLSVPRKRPDARLVSFLRPAEVEALLGAPDRSTRLGRRDHVLLALAVQTGLRVSELTGLRRCDVQLSGGPAVHCRGKGRRERWTPLTPAVRRAVRGWIDERGGDETDPLFPSLLGGRLSTDAVADLLDKHLAVAAHRCPTLSAKHVTPHALRHTCAMNLLQAGVDVATIALWLGHSGTKTVAVYTHADMAMKERALARTAPLGVRGSRYRPPDPLLAFLKSL